MGYILVILLAYLTGSSSMTWYISKAKGIDARKHGSGNLGASNATTLMGWHVGALVVIHDAGKTALAVILAGLFFPSLPYIGAVAGIASILGHIFPFYLDFRGGKGFASYIGMTLALNWKVCLAVVILALIATVLTDYIVVATISTVTIVPVILGLMERSLILALILCIASVVMYFKHIDNFKRILSGTEIGLRSAARGEHRIK